MSNCQTSFSKRLVGLVVISNVVQTCIDHGNKCLSNCHSLLRESEMSADSCSCLIKLYIKCYQPVVEHPFMVQWVTGSIPHGRPIKLFLVPASTP